MYEMTKHFGCEGGVLPREYCYSQELKQPESDL